MFRRNTWMEINTSSIKRNVQKIVEKYAEYEYFFGVVKADCYGHKNGVIKTLLEGGINYLAVATLDEALTIRNDFADVPILCLGVVPKEYVKEAINANVTLTIPSIEYVFEIFDLLDANAKVHIKINTGMNRLGVSSAQELIETYDKLVSSGCEIEGIYSHIYDALNAQRTEKQMAIFEELINHIDYEKIKIRHLAASETIVHYKKMPILNGCRLGIMFYGFVSDNFLELESTFKLKSEIIQIHKLHAGEVLGYDGKFVADSDTIIGVVPIGYADGIDRRNTGRMVYINDQPCEIIGNVCMDMMFVKINEGVKLHDVVEVYKDTEHVCEVAKYIGSIPHEMLVSIGDRVERVYE